MILEAGGDADDPARRIADDYPMTNVQDYTNLTSAEVDSMTLTKSGSTDPIVIPNALKKHILSLKGFWQCWGDNTTKDWTVLSLDDFEDYLVTDTGCWDGTTCGSRYRQFAGDSQNNGEIGAMSVESGLAGVEQHNKTSDAPNE